MLSSSKVILLRVKDDTQRRENGHCRSRNPPRSGVIPPLEKEEDTTETGRGQQHSLEEAVLPG